MTTAVTPIPSPQPRSGSWAGPAALATLTVIVCLFVLAAGLHLGRPAGVGSVPDVNFVLVLGLLGLSTVGAIIVAKGAGQQVGWLLLGIGLAIGASAALAGFTRLVGATDPDVAAIAGLAGGVLWKAGLVQLPVMFLLFPTGRLPSRRWLPVPVALLALAAIAALGDLFRPGPVDSAIGAGPDNPWAMPAVATVLGPIIGPAGFLLFGLLMLLSAGSLIFRFRHADVKTRAQLQWFILGCAVLAASVVGNALLQLFAFPGTPPALVPWPATLLQAIGILAIAAAIAVAMLRHQLFDVDRVASRSLAYGGLAVMVTTLYVALVVGIGAALQHVPVAGTISPFLAAAIVAVAFHPLRTRLVRVADGLVYGHRASPYEVLAETTRQVAATLSASDALPVMSRALAEGTASTAAVWLREPAGWRLGAVSPAAAIASKVGDGQTFEVRQGDEVLGALVIDRNSSLTPTELGLASDLAAQAGILLRNAALVDQLRASAARLVAVQESTRRRLERDLHDGAQQLLTAVAMKLGLARSLLPGDPRAASAVLDELVGDTHTAVAEVREIARGVFPPLLTSQGLAAALTARCRRMPLPTTLGCPGERYPAYVEAAIYFCCAEALQNVAKHAGAQHCQVQVRQECNRLHLEVTDDGHGFDPQLPRSGSGLNGMADRLVALGGELTVTTRAGTGTSITGWVPTSTP